MPTAPTRDSSKDRGHEFIGARILEASEVTALQALALGDQPTNSSYALGALYQTGATLNMQPVFNTNTSCTLAPLNSQYPMFVFVNGRFEAFSPVSLNYPAIQTDGTVQPVYLNWVLWRVTADGANGTIQDATLIDNGTQEPTANAAQLQLSLGADDSGPLNATTMIARNTSPIPIMTLVWQASALQFQSYTSANSYALGGQYRYGLLRSTTTTPTVVADDDPRNSDARTPKPASVVSGSVHPCQGTGSQSNLFYQDQTNTTASLPYATVTTDDTQGGVSSDKVFYSTWGATLSDTVSILWGRIIAIFGVLASYGLRLTALEEKPTADYSWHVGKTLGIVGPNKSTHPPIVDNNNPDTAYSGFAVTTRQSQQTGAAYGVTAYNSTPLGSINLDGDYNLTNPVYTTELTGNSTDFRVFSRLASWAFAHRTAGLGLRGFLASGAPLDTHDPTIDNRNANTRLAGFQVLGTPQVPWDYAYAVKDNSGAVLGGIDFGGNYQYANPANAASLVNGGFDFRTYSGFAIQVLAWLLNQKLMGGAIVGGVRPETTANGNWFLITFGTVNGTRHELAFGFGQLTHGESIQPPVNYSGITQALAIPANFTLPAGKAMNGIACSMVPGTFGGVSQLSCQITASDGNTYAGAASYFAMCDRYYF